MPTDRVGPAPRSTRVADGECQESVRDSYHHIAPIVRDAIRSGDSPGSSIRDVDSTTRHRRPGPREMSIPLKRPLTIPDSLHIHLT